MLSNKNEYLTYVRNFIFGVEDSLVSTVGLLSGIAVTNVSTSAIALTGVVLIFVEAFSMGVGSYLSEHSTANYEGNAPDTHPRTSIIAGVIMLASYLAAGIVPLLPYLIAPRQTAFWLSIASSLVALFILGALSATMLKSKIWIGAIRMFLLGGTAIAIGITAGKIVERLS